MREEKHTPGPWVASYDDRNGEHVIRMGEAINTPWSFPSEQIVRYDHSLYPDDENDAEQWAIAEANARVMAAAPDLLAVAQYAEAILADVFEGKVDPVTALDAISDLAKPAIAKALTPTQETQAGDVA